MSEEKLVIHNRFSDVAAKFPQQTALQFKKDDTWQKLTYRELETQALKIANFLLNAGFKKGDTACIILENQPEWIIIYLGIMYAGMVCVPLDSQLMQLDLKNFIVDSSAKVAFCSQDVFSKKISPDIQKILNKIIILDREWPIEGPAERKNLPLVNPEDIASLIYTSGTTDKPKGVLLTHKNICSNFISTTKLNLCSASDNFTAILPLYHIYPFMASLIMPLFLGARVTFFPAGFKPQDLAKIIKEQEVTILVGVPQLFSLIHSMIFQKVNKIPYVLRFFILPLIKRKIKSIFGKSFRVMVSGGARLDPRIGSEFLTLGLKVVEGYGLTETSPVVTFNPLNKIKFGSVGKPISDVQIKIYHPDKYGVGQILIKGPNVMAGYFKQPELTSLSVKDDWLYSGDLGYIDKEGYLFLTGREKEVIVLDSGKTIYPEELEEYYQKSPYIKEICILQKKENRFGYQTQSLYAVVVPDLEYFRQKQEGNIRDRIRWELENLAKQLPRYKHVMGFTVTKEELPHTALRKIKRYEVRQKFVTEEKAAAFDFKDIVFTEKDLRGINQDIAKKIIYYLFSQLKKPVYLDSHLELDLGIDSLTRVELGLGLEELFSIELSDEVLYAVSTVRDVISKVSELADKTAELKPQELALAQKTWSQILEEEPPEEIVKRIRLKTRLSDILLTFLFKNILVFIFRTFWFLKIKGSENLPKQGPFILCPNHASYLDGFVVFCGLPFKLTMQAYFVGRRDIFEYPLLRWALKLSRLIPFDTASHLTEAMQAASYVLSAKKITCIFPEGQRSIDENVQPFKKGIGILLKELGVRVVPVYIKGSHRSWPRGRKVLRFCHLEIIFGKPVLAKDLVKEKPAVSEYEAIALALREEVIKLR